MSGTTNRSVRFSYNWNNKLDCKAFTTIRIRDDVKYVVGEIYNVYLEEKNKPSIWLGTVELKHKRRDRKNELDAFTAYLDTGYSAAETRKILERMYKVKPESDLLLDVILMVWVKREKAPERAN